MNEKDSVFVSCAEVKIYLLSYNLHDCTFKLISIWIQLSEMYGVERVNSKVIKYFC